MNSRLDFTELNKIKKSLIENLTELNIQIRKYIKSHGDEESYLALDRTRNFLFQDNISVLIGRVSACIGKITDDVIDSYYEVLENQYLKYAPEWASKIIEEINSFVALEKVSQECKDHCKNVKSELEALQLIIKNSKKISPEEKKHFEEKKEQLTPKDNYRDEKKHKLT